MNSYFGHYHSRLKHERKDRTHTLNYDVKNKGLSQHMAEETKVRRIKAEFKMVERELQNRVLE